MLLRCEVAIQERRFTYKYVFDISFITLIQPTIHRRSTVVLSHFRTLYYIKLSLFCNSDVTLTDATLPHFDGNGPSTLK